VAEVYEPGTVTVRQRCRWSIWAGSGVLVMALGLAVSLEGIARMMEADRLAAKAQS
jgi:hypothetical protein